MDNQFKKKKTITIFLFIIILISFFVGFFLNENAAGGGPLDFGSQWKNHLLLKQDIWSFLYNNAYYESHLPTFAILLIKVFTFINSPFDFRLSVFICALVLIILFYVNLKKQFSERDSWLPYLILNLLILSPYFRTSSFWGLQENLAYIFFLIVFYLDSFVNIRFKPYLVLLFSILCFYADQKFFFVPIIYYFKYLYYKKILSLKNFAISIFSFTLIIPSLVIFYYWKGLVPYWVTPETTSLARLSFNINGIFNACQILAIYFFPILLIINNYDTKKFFFKLLVPFTHYNYLYYFFAILSLVYIFFNEPNYNMGGGAIHKIYFLIKNKNSNLATFFYIIYTFLSIAIVTALVTNLKKNIYSFFFIFYFIIVSLIIFPLFQEYFDPLVHIILFLFLLKDYDVFFKFNNIMFLNFYYIIFLLGCITYYSFFRIY